MPKKDIVAAMVGDRVKFVAPGGQVKLGVIERFDENTFPGKVVVRGDDGMLHEIQVLIGWADDAP